MAIRVYDKYDFEGEAVCISNNRLCLGEAKQFAIDNNCTVMIRTWKGWEFKKGPTREDILQSGQPPTGLIHDKSKSVYII